MQTEVFQGILIPFLGTTLGSACVLFPAIEQSDPMGKLSFLPAVAGFWLGILFLLLLDRAVPHLHMNGNKAEGPESSLQKQVLLALAVTLHNLPEGMAVGAALTILAVGFVVPLLPYLLSFAAGFTVMMALDVALG